MTAFILVPGAHTGGWVWQEVAARLREAGAEAHPATLTGMGDRRHEAGPDTDLETHVRDVVELIDRTGAPDVVLVGHCYGIHPVLGAAGHRPERVARIVYLDAGLPQDGDPPLNLIPDQALRDRLSAAPGTDGPARDDWRVPPPPPGAWHRWGSLDGVPEAALTRLADLAAPQPAGTLTQPLRLTEAAAALPTTGILCTANGSSIAMVEQVLRLGDPRLLALVDPKVTFAELHTGHWPMLSAPGDLTDALLDAAAGKGHRLTAPEDGRPGHLRPFLLDVPERPRERTGRTDLYLPDGDGPHPAVVFVHGGPVPAGARPTPRDWPAFTGYGRYVAGLGAAAVTVDHRLHDVTDYPRAAEDVAAAVAHVRADPRIDADRIALWFFSGGGPLAAEWLAAPPPWLRCVAATYPILVPPPAWGLTGPRFHPADAVRTAGPLPVVLTRVEHEVPGIAATVREFLTAAEETAARVEVIDVPEGHHGFETLDHTEPARNAVRHAVHSLLHHLRA
ncbi:alpha/beta hydrolase [Streptomyces sp. Ru73]|uniref:alpha/beta fold hydrolase n=1 Tax=Streptomyces sp. Ru73 TaxID=2080748 RepID=UPI000CDDF736|nr:alpha/beta fold hydrolase [Streptomyces sp. Ru73]POX38734.1 alpha/beta hydrolase [Streptomyces sp. Ru73]